MEPATMMGMAQIAGSVLGFLGSEETNQANSAQSQAQMDFQERMSNTSYQRAVTDMKAAGLNPMLAYAQGGASSPGGSQAVMQNSGAAAAAGAQAAESVQLTRAQTDKTKAEADAIRSTTPETIAEIKQRVLSGVSGAGHTDQLARRLRQFLDEGGGSWEGRHAFEKYARDRVQRKGEEWQAQNDSQLRTPQISSIQAGTRRAVAAAILDELEQPRYQGEAGYWRDVGKGGVYAEKGLGMLGKAASSAASVGLRAPRRFNELTVRGQNGSISRSGQR